MGFTITSFQNKDRNKIILFQTIGSVLWFFHYLMLGRETPALLNLVSIARNTVFIYRGKKKWADSLIWIFVFNAFFIVIGALGYKDLWDILPIAASLVSSVALYVTKENSIRLLSLGVSPVWLIYNVRVGSIGGTICEIFDLISIFVGLYRYGRKKKSFRG